MKTPKPGFTLIELLVVIAIIGILAGMLMPVITHIRTQANRAKTKTTINQLHQALVAYSGDNGGSFPPEAEGNVDHTLAGGNDRYLYYDGVFVKYLDGDITNGGPRIPYFTFEEQYVKDETAGAVDANHPIYADIFDERFWYHNFSDDDDDAAAGIQVPERKSIDKTHILHPWYNRILFSSFQIYCRANYTDPDGDGTASDFKDAYDGKDYSKATAFRWITNYSD